MRSQGYQSLNQVSMSGGPHSQPALPESVLEAGGLVSSESMDVTNYPRFFQDVINYRITAFGSMAVVSGLMVQNAMDHIFGMKKHMTITHIWNIDKVFQTIAFILLVIVLVLNIISTYVGVAQPYHTIRLMTSGPTGFEAAATYYLNSRITTWRHFAIHGALSSLPLFVASSGFRMVVKFDWENMKIDDPESSAPDAQDRIIGIIMCAVFLISAIGVWYIHRTHFAVFNEKYDAVRPSLDQHADAMSVMSGRSTRTRSW